MLEEDLAQELQSRRRALLESLGDDVLVLFSAPVHRRNNDVEHAYRQHSDFYYLTGLEEPEAALVLRRRSPSYVLFVRERNPEREQWDGRRAGCEGAREVFGAEEAYPITDLEKVLPDLLQDVEGVAYLLGEEADWDRVLLRAVNVVKSRARKKVTAPRRLVDAAPLLHASRRIKSTYEVQQLRRVATISAVGHRSAMTLCRPGLREFELQAELESEFRRAGAPRLAYESIVGSGENATILHYRENGREMRDGELVLIDAGAEFAYLAADITRTFPVGARFTEAQKRLYELVLAAHAAALRVAVPGKTLEEVHQAAFDVIADGLAELGWLGRNPEERDQHVRRYFMHRTSHYLGMDVHDVGPYHLAGASLPLEPGVVITIEPGLYVSAGDEAAPEEYWNVGIRIEDDVLITAGEPEVLTSAVPRSVAEIEALRGGAEPRQVG